MFGFAKKMKGIGQFMKYQKIGIVLLAILLMLAACYFDYMSQHLGQDKSDEVRAAYIEIETTRQTTDSVEARVSFWHNEMDGKYYLFLPSGASDHMMQLHLEGIEAIAIDGQYMKDGEEIILKEGEHTYAVEEEAPKSLFVMESAGIGSIFLETESGSLDYLLESKEHMEGGEVLFLDEEASVVYKSELEYIKGRGNSSWNPAKPAFRIKLKQKADIYGMGSAKNWNMVPNAEDPTLMRNAVVYTWADLIGLQYSPQYRFVDWYTNGEYRGSYQICTSIEVGEERVAIADLEEETERMNTMGKLEEYEQYKVTVEDADVLRGYHIPLNPEDISGGYLLELEIASRYNEDVTASGFLTERNQNVVIKSPKYATVEQAVYISELYQQMEDAIYSESGYHQETGLHYSDYIDLESFAKKYLIEEITKNLDAASTSQYLYKPRNSVSSKIFAGPVWDYDKALGNGGVRDNLYFLNEPDELYAAIAPGNGVLWKGLYVQPEFYEYVCAIFNNSFLTTLQEINQEMGKNQEILLKSAMMNAYRCNQFYEADTLAGKQQLYQEEVQRMQIFLNTRCSWLQEQWS